MTTDEIAELRRLVVAATPGPWEREHGIIWGAGGREKVVYSGALTHDVATLEFIATSREAIPKLLDIIEAQHKVLIENVWFDESSGHDDLCRYCGEMIKDQNGPHAVNCVLHD